MTATLDTKVPTKQGRIVQVIGAIVDVDSFFLGFTNAAVAATFVIQRGTGLGTGLVNIYGSATFRRAEGIDARHPGFA